MDGNLLHTIKEGGGICENYELSLYGCLPDLYWMRCSVWKYLHWARWWVVYYRCSLTGIAIAGYMYSLWFTTVHLSCSLSSAQHIIKQRRWRVNLNYMPWFIQSNYSPLFEVPLAWSTSVHQILEGSEDPTQLVWQCDVWKV